MERQTEGPTARWWRHPAVFTVGSALVGIGALVAVILLLRTPLADGVGAFWIYISATLVTLLAEGVGVYLIFTASEGDAPDRREVVSRIGDATRALQTAADLVAELQAEMQAKTATLERLQAENASYEELAALNRAQAEAVSHLVETVISGTHSKLNRSSRRDQLLFLGLGLLASVPIGILVNWLT